MKNILDCKDGSENNPNCMRYINRTDIHTLKAIEIIGRKKYKKLLKHGVIVIGYNMFKTNYLLTPKQRKEELKKLFKGCPMPFA